MLLLNKHIFIYIYIYISVPYTFRFIVYFVGGDLLPFMTDPSNDLYTELAGAVHGKVKYHDIIII